MFQQMLNASRGVLLRPSVATFEEHERNDLGWAAIYIAIGAVVTAILSAIGFALRGPAMEDALRQFEDQLGGQPLPPGIEAFAGGAGLGATIFTSLLGAIIGFFIWTGIVYLLGRAFGGTGAYGELAYDIALFQAPLRVISALISLVGFGPLACLTGLISFALSIYGIYLSWLSVQAGMNLPGNKALMVILIPILVIFLLVCGCIGFFLVVASSVQTSP
jgi:hypothetical protein